MEPKIKLTKMSCEGNRLGYEFSSSLKTFKKQSFYIEYDRNLEQTVESINAIPFAAVMAPIAWATGSDLVMPCLDSIYARSLLRLKEYFRQWFANKWSFQSELFARWIENRPYETDGVALLFSSGLDSLTSYQHHRGENPELFTVFGADIPIGNREFIRTCKQKFDQFAKDQAVRLSYIYTDIRDVFDYAELKRYSQNWYGEIDHALLLSSLLAPVTYPYLKKLYVASCTHVVDHYPCGSAKGLVNNISWASSSVNVDNLELRRSQKLSLYFKDHPELYPYLRVCWMQFENLNCSECEKCLRTMCDLLLNNIDPALCNFKIDERTLADLKGTLTNRFSPFLHGEGTRDFWRSIQDSIQLNNLQDMYGSRQFFEWLAGYQPLKSRQTPWVRELVSALIETRSLLARSKNLFLSGAKFSHSKPAR